MKYVAVITIFSVIAGVVNAVPTPNAIEGDLVERESTIGKIAPMGMINIE